MSLPPPFAEWFPDATFDGSYGFTLDTLRQVTPVPAYPQFAQRWRGWREQARLQDAAVIVLDTTERGDRRVQLIEYSGADGLRLRAWAIGTSGDRPAAVGVVHSHGYGGRDEIDLARVPADAVAIFPVARGLGVLNAGIGASAEVAWHVNAGLDDPDTCVIGLCARDLWLAADALVHLFGDHPLYYVGESFGGGIGALAVPWDDRYVGATLGVPTFGQYDLRLAVRCVGSGEFQRLRARRRPETREQLRLFDASTAASFFRIPVRVEAALWDQAVPPQGQFAVANAVPHLELAVLPAGHAEYPGVAEQTAQTISDGLAHLRRCAPAKIS